MITMVGRKVAIYKKCRIQHSSQEIMMMMTTDHYDDDDEYDLCNSAQWPNVNVESPQQ